MTSLYLRPLTTMWPLQAFNLAKFQVCLHFQVLYILPYKSHTLHNISIFQNWIMHTLRYLLSQLSHTLATDALISLKAFKNNLNSRWNQSCKTNKSVMRLPISKLFNLWMTPNKSMSVLRSRATKLDGF